MSSIWLFVSTILLGFRMREGDVMSNPTGVPHNLEIVLENQYSKNIEVGSY